MLSVTSELVTNLLGDVFVSWLSCDPIMYLLCFAIIAIIITFLFKFLKP